MKKMVSLLVLFLVASAMLVSATPVNGWEYDNTNSRWICRSRTGCYTNSGIDQRDLVLHDYIKMGARDNFNPSSVGSPPEHIIPQITPQAQTLMQQMNIRVDGTNLVFPNGRRVNFDPSGLSTQTLEVSITAENGNLNIVVKDTDFSEVQYLGTTAQQIFEQIQPDSSAAPYSGVDTPVQEISFQLPGSEEFHRYIKVLGGGDIEGIQYIVSYYDSEHGRVIYFDSSGTPIGYSEDEGFTKVRYRENIGPEAKALKEAISYVGSTTLIISSDETNTFNSPATPHVLRDAGGVYRTEKGYYFYDTGLNLYLQETSTLEGQRVVSIREIARSELGEELYKTYGESQIDWGKSNPVNYVLKSGGTMAVVNHVTAGSDPVKSAIVQLDIKDKDQPDKDKSGTYIIKNGQQVAFQSLKQQEEGTITVGGNPFYVGKDKDTLDNLASGKVVKYYESADAKNQLGVIAVQGDSRTITNFKEETQTVYNTQTGTVEQREGDYYPNGERSCTDASGCFRPSGGEIRDANGNLISLLNYDYESTGGAGQGLGKGGKIPGLKRIERFDPISGTFDGIEQPDGTIITAQKNDKGEYSGGYLRTGVDGRITTLTEDSEGRVIVTYDSQIQATERQFQQATQAVRQAEAAVRAAKQRLEAATTDAEREAIKNELTPLRAAADETRKLQGDAADRQQEAQDQANQIARDETPAVLEVKSTTRDWRGRLQRGVEAVYAITSQIKSYPALTRLIGLPRVDQDLFQFDADKTFAPMLGSNWFPSAICEAHYDIEPEGMAVIKTVSGTYQAVANIQMERSETTSPILCARNPDPEAEEEFICDPGQVCVDNSFCYQDEDGDKEPDEDTPLGGYFYKITWGVSAPRDEAFTPFINEDGVAVSFNVWIDTTPNDGIDAGATHMYIRNGDVNGPIELRNGQSDKDVIVHYSPNLFQEACIGWSQAPSTVDMLDGNSEGRRSDGFFRDLGESTGIAGQEGGPFAVRNIGGVTGIETVGDVCFTVDVSSIGEANFGNAGRNAPASTVQGGQVTRNAGW